MRFQKLRIFFGAALSLFVLFAAAIILFGTIQANAIDDQPLNKAVIPEATSKIIERVQNSTMTINKTTVQKPKTTLNKTATPKAIVKAVSPPPPVEQPVVIHKKVRTRAS